MRRYLSWFVPLLFLFCVAGTAHGTLIISVGSVSLAPGETKPVEVMIRSDATNLLQAFGIRLQLAAPANGLLRFVDPPTNGELADMNYVFFGDSDAVANGPTATVDLNGNTYDGADITASGSNVTITTSDRLLVRLDVTALPGATPGTFNLSFVDSLATFYDDAAILQDFQETSPGLVTVIGPSSADVPEPSSLALFGFGLAYCVAFARRRRTRYVVPALS